VPHLSIKDSMADLRANSWQAPYLSASLEIDPTKMLSRMDEALKAIDERLRTPPKLIEGHEHKAIEGARIGLAAFKAARTFRIDLRTDDHSRVLSMSRWKNWY
jgi:hypothetical protein